MAKAEKQRPAGVRVVNGKRIDLKALRERRAARKKTRPPAAPIEDERVTQAWARQERRDISGKRLAREGKVTKKLADADGGKEGAIITAVNVKLSSRRSESMAMRARPGTFEWRYGRNKQDALFHAGSHLAQLWERAGMTTASSADFLRGVASGFSTGISEGRVQAMEKLEGFRDYLGRGPLAGAERMINYCVIGLTSAQIAAKDRCEERAMSTVLHHDLRKTAEFLGFVRKQSPKANVEKARSGHEMT